MKLSLCNKLLKTNVQQRVKGEGTILWAANRCIAWFYVLCQPSMLWKGLSSTKSSSSTDLAGLDSYLWH